MSDRLLSGPAVADEPGPNGDIIPVAAARTSASLTRDQILSAPVKVKSLEVEGLGRISLRLLSVASFAALLDFRDKTTAYRFAAQAVARSVCDEAGKLVFADTDVDAICEMDFKVVMAIAKAVYEFNGLSAPAEGEEDDAEKKASPPTSSDSTSSPNGSE